MVRSSSRRASLVAAAITLAIAGCASPGRLPAVPVAFATDAATTPADVRYLVGRELNTYAAEGRSSIAKERAWLESQGHAGPLPPATFLAVSGGSDNGAFGAGLLSGWTASGTRPKFKVVTGVSTGALIAPFAFLGPKYDSVLERMYTQVAPNDIYRKRGLLKGFFGDAMADSVPLAKLIEANVDQAFLDEVAQEYSKGRILLVGTANLDSLEPVIWNMTAIAARRGPQSVQLFRKVLLASASIPGVFPPVMIDVTTGGARHQEMHVDGGTLGQVFLFPPSLTEVHLGGVHRKRVAYVIRNARLDAEWTDVPRRTLPIAARAIGALTRAQGIGDLYRIYATTQKGGIEFNLAHIPSAFNASHSAEFDTSYMRRLYANGREMALAGFPWEKSPPGLQALPEVTTPTGK